MWPKMRIKNKTLIKLISYLLITLRFVHIKYTWCILHANDNSITVSCLLLKAEYENSNLDCITIKDNTHRIAIIHLVLFWNSCPLVSDERDYVGLSLSSAQAQNDGYVPVVRMATVALVAEWSPFPVSMHVQPKIGFYLLQHNLITAKLLHKH